MARRRVTLDVLSERRRVSLKLDQIAISALISAAITFVGTLFLLHEWDDFTEERLCGDFQARVARASAQRESVDVLREQGYQFTYDFLNTPSSDPAPAVKRLIDAYGPDFVGRPFYAGNSGDVGDVEKLCTFPSLQNVDFIDSNVSDGDLRAIAKLPHLRVLFLNHTNIGSEGIRHLGGTRIEVLHLYGCSNIDDSCIPHLSRMVALKMLDIEERNFSEQALRDLSSALPNCKF